MTTILGLDNLYFIKPTPGIKINHFTIYLWSFYMNPWHDYGIRCDPFLKLNIKIILPGGWGNKKEATLGSEVMCMWEFIYSGSVSRLHSREPITGLKSQSLTGCEFSCYGKWNAQGYWNLENLPWASRSIQWLRWETVIYS